jgi:hypothetical protein
MRSLLVLALATAAASAQPAADSRTKAATAFEAAKRAFEEEDYPQALQLFRAAFAAAPDDTVRFNVAVCLERLGRFREAALEYDAAAQSVTLGADVRGRARTEAERVRTRLGTLVVDGLPGGAKVSVDGVDLCRLPCTIQVDPGKHEIVATAPGGSDREHVSIDRAATTRITISALPPPERRGLGLMTWFGASGVALGAAGAVGFGLRARTLHEQYVEDPTIATRDKGVLARNLANASLAVGAVGVVAVLLDVVVLSHRTRPVVVPSAQPVGAQLAIEF